MNRRLKLALSAALAAVALHTDSFAATTSGTMPLTVGIGTTCSVASSGFNLGSYASTTAAINAAVGVFVTCSNGLTYVVDLDPGTHPTTGNTSRQFGSGTNRLAYNLYTSNAYTQVWGNSMSGGTAVGFTGNGTQQYQSVYLQIPAGTTPPTGIYTDTITVTASF